MGPYAIALAILVVGLGPAKRIRRTGQLPATEEITMMYWGDSMGGWGMLLMTVSTLLFWALVIAGIVALVRYAGHGARHSDSAAETSAPQRMLAERFARGEIDEEEYTRRLAVLVRPARPAG